MKTKKLIAILTIVALMMTLVPMAAFGFNQVTSTIAANVTSLPADDTSVSTLTVTFDTPITITNPASAAAIYVWAERNGVITHEDTISFVAVTGSSTFTGPEVKRGNGVLEIPLAAADSVEGFTATVKSAFPGKTVIRVGIGNTANATTVAGMTNCGQIVVRPEITFNAGSLNAANSTVPATASYAIGSSATPINVAVKDSNNYPIKDATITAVSDRIDDSVVIAAKTNIAGAGTIYFTSSKAGTSNVRIYANGTHIGTTVVTVTGGGVASAEYYMFGSGKIAKNSPMMVQFKLMDKNGNPATPAFGALTTSGNIYYRVDGPAGTTFDWVTEDTATSATAGPGVTTFTGTKINAIYDSNKGIFTVGDAVTKYTVNGTYKVTVGVHGTDISATTTFDVVDQGPITGLSLLYWQSQITYGATTEAPVVQLLDKDGVSLTATTANLKYSINDPRLATVSNLGDATHGKVTALNNSATGLTGDVIVTVTDMVNKVSGNATIKVAGIPTKITATSDTTEVGSVAKVNLQMQDFNGNDTSFGDVATPTMDLIIVSAPADAKVSTTKGVDFDKALKRGGNPYFNVVSDKAGDVVVNIVLGDGTNFVSGSATVKFGEPKEVIGAKRVTMFIGAKGFVQDGIGKVADVAPFIKDDRTFVEVRSLADAFGVTPENILFENNVVTLVRSDMTVTITIGGNVTKTVNGVTTEVPSDAPAFITEAGRTVLPFRAVGEAFGATVDYDATTQAVSFVQE